MFEYIIIFLKFVGVGIGIYFARFLKPFLFWIKGGIENGDGKLTSKELQVSIFTLLVIIMVLSYAIWGIVYPDILTIGVLSGAGIYYAVNRFSDTYKDTHNDKKDKEK